MEPVFRIDVLTTVAPSLRRGAVATAVVTLLAVPALAQGEGVERWRPAGISSPQFESHPAFDPRTGELYFVRSAPDFSGWRILVSRCGEQGWSEPVPPSFAGPGLEADPYFADGGDAIYYISTRATGSALPRVLDIWRVARTGAGPWGKPERLPEPVNSAGPEWFPRPNADGWLYFGSARKGGVGGNDIWRARRGQDGTWTVENVGPSVNTAGQEYEPLPAPDGESMVVATDAGLFETRRAGAGWSPRVALGPEVNVNGSEIGALFSPSGGSLLFARDTGVPDSGELFLWHREGHEAWPPECPPRRSQ
jgi:hypothetical protein